MRSIPNRQHPRAALVVVVLLLAGCFEGGWDRQEIGLIEVRGTTLIVGSHCNEDARARVEEQPDTVEVTFEVKGEVRGECYGTVEVVLDEPPAGRALIDTATGDRAHVGEHR